MSGLSLFLCNSEYQEILCKNKDFRNVVMPSEDSVYISMYISVLEFNQYQKSDKAPFVIYVDLECLIGRKSNPENSFTTEVSEHPPTGFSMSTIS